jgi:hypothetical protein
VMIKIYIYILYKRMFANAYFRVTGKEIYDKIKKKIMSKDRTITESNFNNLLIEAIERKLYKNEYDPQIFLKILKENNIQVKDYSNLQEQFPKGTVHTPFSEIEEMIKTSCRKLIDNINNTYPFIIFIPMFSEQAGSNLTKSNFWFSLLYLEQFEKIKSGFIKDVVLIGDQATEQNQRYFTQILKSGEFVNIIVCDDGIYSGTQMQERINYILKNKCYMHKINQIHICVPFNSSKKFIDFGLSQFNDEEYEELKSELIKLYMGIEQINDLKIDEEKKRRRKEVIYKDVKNYLRYRFNPPISKYDNLLNFLSMNFKMQNNIIKFLVNKFIFVHTGKDNYNLKKNRWFDHKIPDIHSFTPQPSFDIIKFVEPPYKKKWTFYNKNLIHLQYVKSHSGYSGYNNPNILILNNKYDDESDKDLINCNDNDELFDDEDELEKLFGPKTEFSKFLSILSIINYYNWSE